jgi:hypothetical protein
MWLISGLFFEPHSNIVHIEKGGVLKKKVIGTCLLQMEIADVQGIGTLK